VTLRAHQPRREPHSSVSRDADLNAGGAVSIHTRLLVLAKSRGEDFNLTFNRNALERFLYRLSASGAREHYWLEGALLFGLRFDVPHRPTCNANILDFGPAEYASRPCASN